jgi:hypothetical protein
VTRVIAVPDQDPDELLALTAAVEHASEHPIAQAIAAAARARAVDPPGIVEGFRAVPGCGVHARVGTRLVSVGTPEFVIATGVARGDGPERSLDPQATWVAAGWDGQIRGWMGLRDTIKPTARDAVVRLRRLGLTTPKPTTTQPRGTPRPPSGHTSSTASPRPTPGAWANEGNERRKIDEPEAHPKIRRRRGPLPRSPYVTPACRRQGSRSPPAGLWPRTWSTGQCRHPNPIPVHALTTLERVDTAALARLATGSGAPVELAAMSTPAPAFTLIGIDNKQCPKNLQRRSSAGGF